MTPSRPRALLRRLPLVAWIILALLAAPPQLP
jgi:hypothetical protein